MAKSAKTYIGTSGWNYGHWEEGFYPQDVSKKDYLNYYSKHFDVVEVNNSFYNLPEKKTLKEWMSQVPSSFKFAMKASRYMTHMKKLKDPHEPIHRFFSRVEVLQDQLGPILFQLPGNFGVRSQRLSEFIKALPKGFLYTFEFRDKSWLTDEVYEILDHHNCALCIYDMKGETSPNILTADWTYLRWHGPKEKKYEGKYDKKQLSSWKELFDEWKSETQSIFGFFDNDQKAFAAQNAQDLKEMLGH